MTIHLNRLLVTCGAALIGLSVLLRKRPLPASPTD